jgi:hypothetical protein
MAASLVSSVSRRPQIRQAVDDYQQWQRLLEEVL